MKITFLYSLVILLSLIHHNPVLGQKYYMAKATAREQTHSITTGATVMNFNGTINSDRILLSWTIGKNQVVDQIEIEKRNINKKNFVMAGLVFGTNETDKVEYLFYEKNKGMKSCYRLRIINKDRTVSYSAIISPEPSTAKR